MGIDSFRVNRPCLFFQPIRPNWLLVDLFYSQFICISNVRNNTIRISTLSICFYFLRKTNHRIGIFNYVLFQEMEMSFFWHYLDCKLVFFFLKKKECDFILFKQNRSRKFRYFLNIIMVAGSIRVLFSGISRKK